MYELVTKIEEQIMNKMITYLSSPLKSFKLLAELQFELSQKHICPRKWSSSDKDYRLKKNKKLE